MFLDAWLNVTSEKLINFTPQFLARAIHALGLLFVSNLIDTRPNNTFVLAWQNSALMEVIDPITSVKVEKIELFSSQDLANSIFGFGKFGVQPSGHFTQRWQECSATKFKDNDFDFKHAGTLILSLGTLGIPLIEPLLDALQTAAISHEQLEMQFIANTIFGISLGDQKQQFEPFLNALLPKLRIQTFHEAARNQLLQAALYFDLILGDSRLTQALADGTVPTHQPSKSSTQLENTFEKRFKSRGLRRGVDYKKEYIVPETGFPVDFYIVDRNGKNIIQVDGPAHFIITPDGKEVLSPADRRFNEIHKALGYIVRRVSYRDLDAPR